MRTPIVTMALVGLASTAFAGSPHPTAIDADGDGAFAATVDVNADSTLDYKDIGVRASQYDCDDAHAALSPRNTEIVGDGIDNDCSGADAVYPVADPVAKRYLANSGAKGPLAFIAEYDRCTAAIECVTDDVAGTFTINAADIETRVFADGLCGSTSVLGADGIREVLTVGDYSHFRGNRCVGYSGTTSRASGGSSTPRPGVSRSYVDASSGVLLAADKAETEARLAADTEHDRRLGSLESDRDVIVDTVNAHTLSIESLEQGLAAQDGLIVAEIKARKAEIVRVEGKAEDAAWDADAAASHGPLFEGYGLGNLMAGESITDDGDVARNAVFGGGGAGINVGIDGDGLRANAFGETAFGSDGADGVSSNWAAGGEYLWQISDSPAHVGFNVGYAQRSSLVNALETQVLGRMPMAGGTLAVPFGDGASGQHGLLIVRGDVGPEFIGMSGDSVTDSVRFGGRVTVGLGFGVGALR